VTDHPHDADEGRERARVADYEPVQRETCEIAGAPFVAPDYAKLVWLAPVVVAGHRRVFGARHHDSETWSGWSFIADDQDKPAAGELRYEHLLHLVTIREDLMPYLGLPVGWTFAIFDDGSWYAWSPKDQLVTWIGNFLDRTEATPENATGIAETIREEFDRTELAAMLIDPLEDWASRHDANPNELDHTLRWGSEWLERSVAR
jgi:hypothetical protein